MVGAVDRAAHGVPWKSTGVATMVVDDTSSGTSIRAPEPWKAGSANRSSGELMGAQKKSGSVANTSVHSSSVRVAKIPSNMLMSSDALAARSLGWANRSSSNHSGWPTARASGGQWRSPSRPTIQNRRPQPAV